MTHNYGSYSNQTGGQPPSHRFPSSSDTTQHSARCILYCIRTRKETYTCLWVLLLKTIIQHYTENRYEFVPFNDCFFFPTEKTNIACALGRMVPLGYKLFQCVKLNNKYCTLDELIWCFEIQSKLLLMMYP